MDSMMVQMMHAGRDWLGSARSHPVIHWEHAADLVGLQFDLLMRVQVVEEGHVVHGVA